METFETINIKHSRLIKNPINRRSKYTYFLVNWKKAIILIPKPGKDKSVPESYRLLSSLSCLGKLLEQMISRRLRLWKLEREDRKVKANQSSWGITERRWRQTAGNCGHSVQHPQEVGPGNCRVIMLPPIGVGHKRDVALPHSWKVIILPSPSTLEKFIKKSNLLLRKLLIRLQVTIHSIRFAFIPARLFKKSCWKCIS